MKPAWQKRNKSMTFLVTVHVSCWGGRVCSGWNLFDFFWLRPKHLPSLVLCISKEFTSKFRGYYPCCPKYFLFKKAQPCWRTHAVCNPSVSIKPKAKNLSGLCRSPLNWLWSLITSCSLPVERDLQWPDLRAWPYFPLPQSSSLYNPSTVLKFLIQVLKISSFGSCCSQMTAQGAVQ